MLQVRKEELDHQLRKTATEYVQAPNATVKQTLAGLMEGYRSDMDNLESEINSANNVEMESEDFVDFAFSFVNQLRDNWWKLSPEDKKRGEQILFNGRIYINNSAKVHTPTLSSIYTLATIKKAPEIASDAHLVELAGTAPASASLAS